MAIEKDKAIEKEQENIKPAGGKNEELSEKDLDKASGGGGHGYKGYVELA